MSWRRIFQRRLSQAAPTSVTEPQSAATQHPSAQASPPTERAEAALNALLNAPNWDETRAVLEREQATLLGEAAVARLQAAVEEARKDGAGEREVLLDLRLGLLQAAKARGIEAAWPAFLARVQERQAEANNLGQALIPWFNIASPREARRYLEAHPELLQPEADMLFDPLLAQYAGQAAAVQSLT